MRRINLVPPNERQRTATDVGVLGIVALAVVVLFGLGMGYYLLSGQLEQKKLDLADVEQQLAQLKIEVAALESYEQLAAERQQTEGMVQQIYARRTLVATVLDDISQVIPDTAWFGSMELTTSDPIADSTEAGAKATNDSSLSIEGNTYSYDEVAQILVRLQMVPSLTNVTLVSAANAEEGQFSTPHVKDYSFEATLKAADPDDVKDASLPLSQGEVAIK
jgi:Tfp pilus assembly protein PilN